VIIVASSGAFFKVSSESFYAFVFRWRCVAALFLYGQPMSHVLRALALCTVCRAAVAVGLVLSAAACGEPSTALPGIADAQFDVARLEQLRNIGEGCAFTTIDAHGDERGFAVPRRFLPFEISPIVRDPHAHRAPGRAMRMQIKRLSGTAIEISCWIPSSLPDKELIRVVERSLVNKNWEQIAAGLAHAQRLPDRSSRPQLTREAIIFQRELLGSSRSRDYRDLDLAPLAARSGRENFSELCEDEPERRVPDAKGLPTGPTARPAYSCEECFEWTLFASNASGVWYVSVTFYFCVGSESSDYNWMISHNYWQFACGGTQADDRDILRQEYVDYNATVNPPCSVFLYRPVGNNFSWSVIQSHGLFYNYAIFQSVLENGLESLYSDTVFSITTGNRIYSSPSANYDIYYALNVTPALNSRHIYGDAADIQSSEQQWQGLRDRANIKLNPKPCAEPVGISGYGHLHLDYRAATGALNRPNPAVCPTNWSLP
jgi:hypothetical protein